MFSISREPSLYMDSAPRISSDGTTMLQKPAVPDSPLTLKLSPLGDGMKFNSEIVELLKALMH